MVTRLSAILACLLALLVASPLCCCAVETLKDRESSCCCGDASGDEEPCHHCPCASDDPREIPDPLVIPPQGFGKSFECPPVVPVLALQGIPSRETERLRWTPSLPWHAPPAERRARLVSRTL